MDVPDAAALEAAFRQGELEETFWSQRAGELLKRYPDQFVAVYDGAIVAASPNLVDVLHQLQAKGLDAGRTWLRFLARDPWRFVL